MTPRHPRSTPFPTRRSSDLGLLTTPAIEPVWEHQRRLLVALFGINEHVAGLRELPDMLERSEEHTSELQSHHDLVCRLLLEKKKMNKKTMKICKNIVRSIES